MGEARMDAPSQSLGLLSLWSKEMKKTKAITNNRTLRRNVIRRATTKTLMWTRKLTRKAMAKKASTIAPFANWKFVYAREMMPSSTFNVESTLKANFSSTDWVTTSIRSSLCQNWHKIFSTRSTTIWTNWVLVTELPILSTSTMTLRHFAPCGYHQIRYRILQIFLNFSLLLVKK